MGRTAAGTASALVVCALAVVGCTKERTGGDAIATYRDDVAPIATRACVSCHGGVAPAAGWKSDTYVAALGCVAPSGEAAVLPADARAPVLRALGDATHRGLVTDGERDTFARWIGAGAPDVRAGAHPSGVANPRSPDFHGASLRSKHYTPMLDANDDAACGRCHDGTRSRPAGVDFAAPGATACTTCHSEAQGILGCATCHGDGKRAYPPRDPCFFPSVAPTAHRAHVESTATHQAGMPCATCHPTPGADVLGGLHGNGIVDVALDPSRAGAGATFDPATGTCVVSCHNRGGARPVPAWSDLGPLGCNDCHGSPPAAHSPGACSSCHREADAKGTALTGGPLHLNGKVDLGDGSGACGACHGKGTSPWPATNAHPSHRAPALASPFTCASCHPPRDAIVTPGHLDGLVQIAFGDHALDRGASPGWDGATCTSVACHGANLPDGPSAPAWTDLSGKERTCVACHGAPPKEHTASSQCGRSDCHGGEVDTGVPSKITGFGRAMHVDGVVDFNR